MTADLNRNGGLYNRNRSDGGYVPLSCIRTLWLDVKGRGKNIIAAKNKKCNVNWPEKVKVGQIEPFYPPFKIFEEKERWSCLLALLVGGHGMLEGEKLQMLVILGVGLLLRRCVFPIP